jgi:dynein heavy chain
MAKRYEDGLQKLQNASEEVTILQKELEVKQVEVNREKSDVEALLAEIKEKSDLAGKKQIEANEKKKQLDIDSVQISEQKQ